ncbi:MAG TPA: helix-turn-helix transcriptional regulator [Acidimicrobiales bacterium]|nr:helix-turn-helix transcriptional regulator [Acidimicrobiales bacterium]
MTATDTTDARPPAGDLPAGEATTRRAELAAFLRSRRERLTPGDVGLAPGVRRRTPGLRREEVAQLAGVGVTWYTWLEQGRPINVSDQVLEAVARTLRLDGAERAHLHHLAGVPGRDAPDGGPDLAPEVQVILDGLGRLPACVYNGRYDLLAWNRTYAALFPQLVEAPVPERNALWHLFTASGCRCCKFVNRDTEMPRMVATFRGAFGRHVGEPAWADFVRRLASASPEFAAMWAGHDVAEPDTTCKVFRHPVAGELRLTVTSLTITTNPEARLLVYTPVDDETTAGIGWLASQPDVPG